MGWPEAGMESEPLSSDEIALKYVDELPWPP